MIDLSQAFEKIYASHDRTIGRYYASEIWAIVNRYVRPESFFEKKPPTIIQATGIWKHQMVQECLKLMNYDIEPKKEKKFGEWILVGKADAIKDHEGLEIKTTNSLSVMSHAKPWHIYQARILASLFEIPSWFVVQPIVSYGKLQLKAISKIKRDDEWFTEEMQKVEEFHKKLKVLPQWQI